MGVTWYSELYTGKRFLEDLAATAAQISQGTYTGSAFVITIAVNGKDQLDIRHMRDLCRSYLREKEILAVGAAADRREAISLVKQMALDCVRKTGGADLRSYFLGGAGRQSGQAEKEKEAVP